MAQTIKELEKERAGLLKAIESQAQTISTANDTEHSLKDWLNAAEDVMPTNKSAKNARRKIPPIKKRAKAKNSNSTNQITNVPRTPFFLIVILLSFALIVAGVAYIGYMSLKNELKAVKASQEQSDIEVNLLKDFVVTLEPKLKMLENKVEMLQTNPQENAGQLVTKKEELENRFKGVKTQINSIDTKLERIILKLDQGSLNKKQSSSKTTSQNKNKIVANLNIKEPTIIEPKKPTVKPLKQPVVRLVKKITSPKETNIPKRPIADYTLDVKWLMEQPAFNYTLQLASFSDKFSAEKMIIDKSLQGSHIISQQYKSTKKYVVVSGSYPDKKSAHQAASQYKSNFGISPWVRKMKDISAKVK